MTTIIAAAFLSALQSDAPSPEIADNDLYAFLIGSWRGEASNDGGKTWNLEAEFRLRRVTL